MSISGNGSEKTDSSQSGFSGGRFSISLLIISIALGWMVPLNSPTGDVIANTGESRGGSAAGAWSVADDEGGCWASLTVSVLCTFMCCVSMFVFAGGVGERCLRLGERWGRGQTGQS